MRAPRLATLTFFYGCMLLGAAGVEACTDDDSDPSGFDAGGPDSGLPKVDGSASPDAVSPIMGDAAVADAGPIVADAASDATADATVTLNDGAAPVQEISLFRNPSSLAVDAQFLYVATDNGVYRLAKDGSTSERISADEQVHRVWRDGQRIFFSTLAGEVKVVPTNAVGAGSVASVVATDGGPVPIRTANGSVYFGMYNGNAGSQIWAIEEDGGNLRTAAAGVRAYDFEIVAGALYAGGKPDASVLEIPLDGGTRTTRAGSTGLLSDFTTRDSYVYFGTRGGDITRIPVDGGPAEAFATGAGKVAGIAVDDDSVYWVSYESASATGYLRRMPKAGGARVTLASLQRSAFAITVDDTHVYWTSLVPDGGVNRVPK